MPPKIVNNPTRVNQTTFQWSTDVLVYPATKILCETNAFWYGTNQCKFKFADGVNNFAALDYLPIAQTLEEIMAQGNSTGAYSLKIGDNQVLQSENGNSYLDMGNGLFVSIGSAGGEGFLTNADETKLQHPDIINLNAPSVKKNSSEIATEAQVAIVQTDIDNHEADLNNPHQTTLEKARLADNFFEGEVDMNNNRLRNLPSATEDDEPATFGQLNQFIDTTIKALEGFNPVTGNYPVTYGGAAIDKGDSFKFTGTGTVNGIAVKAGDFAIAQIDVPGQIDANWTIGQTNVDQATEAVQGIAKIATQASVEDELTSNNIDIVTPQKGWFLFLRALALPWTWGAKQIFTLPPRFNSAGASQYLKTDGTKDLTSVSAIPAADITESVDKRFQTDAQQLRNDATSSIQTQLDAKLTSANIVETITDGDTTHTSSSNALFDALALKLAKASNLSDLANVATARVNLGLDKITNGGNAAYSILAADKFVVTGTALTAPRIWTLPAAASVNAGYEIIVADFLSTLTSANTITIAVQTGEKLNQTTNGTEVVNYAGGWRRLVSDGVSNWSFDAGLVRMAATQTLTNKRIQPRPISVTQAAVPTYNTDNGDVFKILNLAQAITSMTTNKTGTPADGEKIRFRIKDNGTARLITWGAAFAASGTLALPTTTVISVVLSVTFEWDADLALWVIASV